MNLEVCREIVCTERRSYEAVLSSIQDLFAINESGRGFNLGYNFDTVWLQAKVLFLFGEKVTDVLCHGDSVHFGHAETIDQLGCVSIQDRFNICLE